MGIVRMILETSREVKWGGKSWLKWRNEFSMEVVWVVVCTSRPTMLWKIQHTLY